MKGCRCRQPWGAVAGPGWPRNRPTDLQLLAFNGQRLLAPVHAALDALESRGLVCTLSLQPLHHRQQLAPLIGRQPLRRGALFPRRGVAFPEGKVGLVQECTCRSGVCGVGAGLRGELGVRHQGFVEALGRGVLYGWHGDARCEGT